MHRQIQRPNASLHGGFERRRSNHPTYPRKHPPRMRGSNIAAATAPINPERTQSTRTGEISSSGYDPVAPSTQSTRTGAEHHRMAGNEHYVRLRSRRAPFWQDLAEMHSRTAHFGKNGVFCTLQDGKALSRSTFSEYLARKVWFSCPSVHNARFLPRFSAICPMSRKILLHD